MKRKFLSFALVMCMIMTLFVVMPMGASAATTIDIAADGTTTIVSFADCAGNVSYDETSQAYKFATGNWATATVNVAETGYYALDVNLSTTGSPYMQTWNVTVDNVFYDSFDAWGNNANHFYEGNVLDVYLTKGEHTIKIAYAGGAGVWQYFKNFSLTKKTYDSESFWVMAKSGTITGDGGAVGNTIHFSTNHYIDYTINAPYAGTYVLSVVHGRTDKETTFGVTINDALVDASEVNNLSVVVPENINHGYSIAKIDTLCQVELKAGENTLRLTNQTGFMYMQALKFDPLYVYRVNANESKTVQTIECINSNLNTGYGNGDIAYGQYDYVTCLVNVEEAGYYTLGVKMRNRNGERETWNVLVDNHQEDSFEIWYNMNTYYDNEAVDIYLDAGVHEFKIARAGTVGANHFFNEFKLTKKAVDSKAIWKLGTDYIKKNEYATISHSKQLFSEGGWSSYNIDVDKCGTYKITLQHSYNINEINNVVLSVNENVINSNITLPVADRVGVYGETAVLIEMGTVNLAEGHNTIKIKNNDTTSADKQFSVARIKIDLIEEETENIAIRKLMSDYEEAYNATSDTTALEVQGGYTCWRKGDYAVYNVNVPKAGRYKLGIHFGSSEGNLAGITALVNGTERLNSTATVGATIGDAMEFTSLADMDFGEVVFTTEGENELKLINSGAVGTGYSTSGYSHDFYLILIDEFDADVKITNDINSDLSLDSALTAGGFDVTYKLSNSAASGEVMCAFAVYKKVGDATEVVAAKSVKGTYSVPITLTFDNFTKEENCTYYAKAFIWDGATLQSKVVNYEF